MKHIVSNDKSCDIFILSILVKKKLFVYSFLFSAYGSGQLTLLECPEGIKFDKNAKLNGKYAGQVFRACMGYSTTETVPFALHIESPFSLADYLTLIHINGVTPIESKNIEPISKIKLSGEEEFSIDPLKNVLDEENMSMKSVDLNKGIETVSR